MLVTVVEVRKTLMSSDIQAAERQSFYIDVEEQPWQPTRWPGIEGARSVALQLSKSLRNVSARLLPDDAKDLRGWLTARGVFGDDAWRAAGAELAERIG